MPGDATVILTGWCALVLSGGSIHAARHCVRRVPGVRWFSAILFVAPDTSMMLKPLDGAKPVQSFSDSIMRDDMSNISRRLWGSAGATGKGMKTWRMELQRHKMRILRSWVGVRLA